MKLHSRNHTLEMFNLRNNLSTVSTRTMITPKSHHKSESLNSNLLSTMLRREDQTITTARKKPQFYHHSGIHNITHYCRDSKSFPTQYGDVQFIMPEKRMATILSQFKLRVKAFLEKQGMKSSHRIQVGSNVPYFQNQALMKRHLENNSYDYPSIMNDVNVSVLIRNSNGSQYVRAAKFKEIDLKIWKRLTYFLGDCHYKYDMRMRAAIESYGEILHKLSTMSFKVRLPVELPEESVISEGHEELNVILDNIINQYLEDPIDIILHSQSDRQPNIVEEQSTPKVIEQVIENDTSSVVKSRSTHQPSKKKTQGSQQSKSKKKTYYSQHSQHQSQSQQVLGRTAQVSVFDQASPSILPPTNQTQSSEDAELEPEQSFHPQSISHHSSSRVRPQVTPIHQHTRTYQPSEEPEHDDVSQEEEQEEEAEDIQTATKTTRQDSIMRSPHIQPVQRVVRRATIQSEIMRPQVQLPRQASQISIIPNSNDRPILPSRFKFTNVIPRILRQQGDAINQPPSNISTVREEEQNEDLSPFKQQQFDEEDNADSHDNEEKPIMIFEKVADQSDDDQLESRDHVHIGDEPQSQRQTVQRRTSSRKVVVQTSKPIKRQIQDPLLQKIYQIELEQKQKVIEENCHLQWFDILLQSSNVYDMDLTPYKISNFPSSEIQVPPVLENGGIYRELVQWRNENHQTMARLREVNRDLQVSALDDVVPEDISQLRSETDIP